MKEAYKLDEINHDHKWSDAIEKEVSLLRDVFDCFKLVENEAELTDEYQKIPLLWTFAVKYDLRRRARLVAGGHVTDDIKDDMYSGVVEQ